MKVLKTSIIYENPLPQLRSRQSAFPFLCQCDDNTLAAVHVISEAFESVDGASFISFSHDGGKTWEDPVQMFDKKNYDVPVSESCKVSRLPDGRLLAIGYAFRRFDANLPVGNPATGGILDDFIFYSISEDSGKTWGEMVPIDCSWGPHAEASAPPIVLQNGTWMTPITGFPDWEGKMHGDLCGRALCSYDQGKTWNDDAICMQFGEEPITCYEQRMCQLESGAIICIAWNENTMTGERLCNHYTASYDNGKTWSSPESTGILGQASSVCAIGGEKFLALHAVRRDTDQPGIYGYIIDFSEKQWNIVDSEILWTPKTPVIKDTKMAEIFSYLKFGQPGAILMSDGDVMMSHWYAEEGQYKTIATRIKL